MRFFGMDRASWDLFRDEELSPFVRQHISTKKFDRASCAIDPAFLEFEREVVASHSWAIREGLDHRLRRAVILQAINIRWDGQRAGVARQKRISDSLALSQSSSLYDESKVMFRDLHVKSESGGIQHTTHTRSSIKDDDDDDALMSDDNEEDIEAANNLTLVVLDEALHIRITRQYSPVHIPNLSYQTFIRALQKDMTDRTAILNHLNFKKLQDCATLYLGYDYKSELLAVDYGTKRKPEWLFVQDDASLCSTIQTWHVQYPKVATVEVLVVDRPGFIPWRSPSALIAAGPEDVEMDEDEEGDDEMDEDEDQEEEEGEDREEDKEEDEGENEDEDEDQNEDEDEDEVEDEMEDEDEDQDGVAVEDESDVEQDGDENME